MTSSCHRCMNHHASFIFLVLMKCRRIAWCCYLYYTSKFILLHIMIRTNTCSLANETYIHMLIDELKIITTRDPQCVTQLLFLITLRFYDPNSVLTLTQNYFLYFGASVAPFSSLCQQYFDCAEKETYDHFSSRYEQFDNRQLKPPTNFILIIFNTPFTTANHSKIGT